MARISVRSPISMRPAASAAIQAFVECGHNALLALAQSRLPVIAAVQGLCRAGDTELMLGTDVVFAAKTGRIGNQHAQYGLVPG